MLRTGCRLVGVLRGSFAPREPARNLTGTRPIVGGVADGRPRPHVAARLPFAPAGEALARTRRREVMRKILREP